MIPAPVRAVAGQTPGRFVLKSLLSTVMVLAAASVQKEGLMLALLVIFSGVTGPAIRIMTLKMSGLFDRIRISPVNKLSLMLFYTGVWSASVLAALVPAIAVATYLLGPSLLVPLSTGTVLAVSIGTLSGLGAKTLGDAHLFAIIATVPLIIGTFIPDPWSLILPYPSISMNAVSLVSSLTQIGFLAVWLMMAGTLVSRI